MNKIKKSKKTTDSQLDEIYWAIDALINSNCLEYLNGNLSDLTMKAWRTDVDMLLAYATATLPVKTKLSVRKSFLDKCRSLHPKEELWKGLD